MTLPRKFYQSFVNMVEPQINRLHQQAQSKTDSPIEAAFATAATTLLFFYGRKIALVRADEPESAIDPAAEFILRTQCPIGSYRVDFTLADRSDAKSLPIVIECDGHDFHERTKEQAARDRSRDRHLQGQGYLVYRFTGSEIYRDAFECVAEVLTKLFDRTRASEFSEEPSA